jgi:DNA-binding response OmpR family regulator
MQKINMPLSHSSQNGITQTPSKPISALNISQPALIASKAAILVVDAHETARGFAVDYLNQNGYAADQASSGAAALSKLEGRPYDLVILDVELPGANSVDLLNQLRKAYPDLLIVILTAHATVESAVAAVKLNVVDYMQKPCKPQDLILTISRALEERTEQLRHQRLLSLVGEAMNALRQTETDTKPLSLGGPSLPSRVPGDMLTVGTLALDRQKRQVTLNTNPPRIVELTEGELSILVVLMEKPNQVLSYNDLAKTALGYEGMDKWTVESVIRSTVFRLRHKIEPGPDTPCLIRTVRGRGYFFSPA